jgi:ABC-2 type transport system ATP-binding protein
MQQLENALEVTGLCKQFAGGVQALREVSFAVRPGEVLGLLGENGAGKTTALRILAGFLLPSAGSARVAGIDIASEPLRARARVGYLPEQVPLYRELRVREYLRYRAELKGVSCRNGKVQRAVDAALLQVGLVAEQKRLIGQLSKGYRQRVGLADALLHEPPLLLLDEPTDGLDPNQRREVLTLIGQLGVERAVVLSTHVLPEVETLCQQIVVLSRGRVAANGTLAVLLASLRSTDCIEVCCRGDREILRQVLTQQPGVVGVTEQPGSPMATGLRFVVELQQDHGSLAARCEQLARAILQVGELQELAPQRTHLDAVFRALTALPTEERK